MRSSFGPSSAHHNEFRDRVLSFKFSKAELRALDLIHERSGITRVELIRRTGASAGGMTNAIRRLVEKGLLNQRSGAVTGFGDRRVAIRLRGGLGVVLGVEVNEVEIRIAITTLSGKILGVGRADLEATDTTELQARFCLQQIRRTLVQVGGGDAVLAIGMVVPSEQPSGKCLALLQALQSGLEEQYQIPCLRHDRILSAVVAERRLGLVMSADPLLYVEVATTIRSAVFLGDSLYQTNRPHVNGLAHVCVDRRGPTCACGKRGCLEEVASFRAMLNSFRNRVRSDHPMGTSHDVSSRAEDVSEGAFWEAALTGDPGALLALRKASDHIGHALSDVVNFLAPGAIVIAGSLCRSNEAIERIKTIVSKSTLRTASEMPIIVSRFGKNGPVKGVAFLAAKQLIKAGFSTLHRNQQIDRSMGTEE